MVSDKISKRTLWLAAFLDETGQGFFNRTISAQIAGYGCSSYHSFSVIGHANFKAFKEEINQWLDDEGLSRPKLRAKLMGLIEGKRTVFHKVKGQVAGELPEGVRIIVQSSHMGWNSNKTGDELEAIDDGETLLAIDAEAPDIQIKALAEAAKWEGLHAPKRIEQSGPGGGPMEHTVTGTMDLKVLENAIERDKKSK